MASFKAFIGASEKDMVDVLYHRDLNDSQRLLKAPKPTLDLINLHPLITTNLA